MAKQRGAAQSMVPSTCRKAAKVSTDLRSGSTSTTSVARTKSYGRGGSDAAPAGAAESAEVPLRNSKSVASASSQWRARTTTSRPSFKAAFLWSNGKTTSLSVSVTAAPRAASDKPAAPQPAPSSKTARPCQKPFAALKSSLWRFSQLRSSPSRPSASLQKASAASQTTAPKPYGSARSQSVASWRMRTPGGTSWRSFFQKSFSRIVKFEKARRPESHVGDRRQQRGRR
mmetsp:Transcript_8218/g.20713  ORF Transcript_8218/g.20713 Transcript_8218/m.20713 type:complete len:229 (+) Transcript_8218:330-1016(+)